MSTTINGTSGVTFPDASTQNTAATGFGFKNRIINGAMMIDQRNAGASVTPTASTYTLDRWLFNLSQPSKISIQQNAGTVTPPSGFVSYLGVTSLSSYTVAASEQFILGQRIEGFNVSGLAWGTANASPVTLSFKVYSSLTGAFGGSLRNAAANRSYPFSYTINSANTWTNVSVTIPGDTSGTWAIDNGLGINCVFGLGVGSSLSAVAGSWYGAGYISATGAQSVVGTTGATFYITGVQLEKGSTATSFDYRPYGTELALCQRYYSQLGGVAGNDILFAGYNTSGSNCALTLSLPVQMRATPTGTKVGTWSVAACGQPSIVATSLDTVSINAVATASAPVQYGTQNTTTYVTLAAEL